MGRFGAPPVFAALDANQDGELSAEEIKNAAAALQKLDANKDGKISLDEVRPQGGPRGEGEGPGRFGRGGDGAFQRGGGGGGNNQMVDRIMQSDANNDGKVSKDELPERMQRLMGSLDADKDGFITREEAEKGLAEIRGGGQPGRPEGEGRGRGGRGPGRQGASDR
jgi:Ca2+-binding EF-hand superfamily protein